MSRSDWAKVAGWLGGVLVAAAQSFGKYSQLATATGATLLSLGVHSASNTEGLK